MYVILEFQHSLEAKLCMNIYVVVFNGCFSNTLYTLGNFHERKFLNLQLLFTRKHLQKQSMFGFLSEN